LYKNNNPVHEMIDDDLPIGTVTIDDVRPEVIQFAIAPTVTIVDRIRPVYNLKATT